jgi:RNA polymerase primary sigma factor
MNIILSASRTSTYKPSLNQHNPTQASRAYGSPLNQSTTDHFRPTQRTGNNIQDYLNSIGRVKLLTAEQEITLARQIKAGAETLQGLIEHIGPILNSKKEVIENPGFTALLKAYLDELKKELGEILDSKGKVIKNPGLDDILNAYHAKNNVSRPLKLSLKQAKIVRMAKRAHDQMMTANLRLVVSIAKKYQGNGLELADLIQEGSAGLAGAAQLFDPTKGNKFSTYATPWIRRDVPRAIKKTALPIRLPEGVHEIYWRLRTAAKELTQELGRPPSTKELGDRVQESDELVQMILTATRTPLSLETPIYQGTDSQLGDFIADSTSQTPEESMRKQVAQDALKAALGKLDEQTQQILVLYFGLNGKEEIGLRAIASQLEIGYNRVREMKDGALVELKHLLYDPSLAEQL